MVTDWVEVVRRAAAVLGGIGAGLWIARIIGWVANVDGATLGVVVLGLGVLGGLVGWVEAKRLRPMESQERRDAFLGWGFVAALVFVIAVVALALA
jgi:hypothetical protein